MTTPIYECLINKKTSKKPIWFMRQAGRYLPEFKKIRKLNPDFVKLCLDTNLSSEITLQPLKRFDLSAAIIFSDILMVPYGLKQQINFKKDFGPLLGEINLEETSKEEFIKKLKPIYNCINKVKSNYLIKNKNLIGFIGAPWTLLVYMINKKSPKKNIDSSFFNNKKLIDKILEKLEKILIIHIENQIDNGADIDDPKSGSPHFTEISSYYHTSFVTSPDTFLYPFCLNCAQFQPSGTLNFSRLDSARIVNETQYVDTDIYAVNYNILRIQNGMAGIMYAN